MAKICSKCGGVKDCHIILCNNPDHYHCDCSEAWAKNKTNKEVWERKTGKKIVMTETNDDEDEEDGYEDDEEDNFGATIIVYGVIIIIILIIAFMVSR